MVWVETIQGKYHVSLFTDGLATLLHPTFNKRILKCLIPPNSKCINYPRRLLISCYLSCCEGCQCHPGRRLRWLRLEMVRWLWDQTQRQRAASQVFELQPQGAPSRQPEVAPRVNRLHATSHPWHCRARHRPTAGY